MIQPLRTAHRRVFVALALVLPAVLALGLGARRPRGIANAAARMPISANLVKRSVNLWHKHDIQTEFYCDSDRPQDIYLVLHAGTGVNDPDLLLYWSSSQPDGNTLPTDAQLIGEFANDKAFLLAAGERSGRLILFSLAHQSLYDTTAEERLP